MALDLATCPLEDKPTLVESQWSEWMETVVRKPDGRGSREGLNLICDAPHTGQPGTRQDRDQGLGSLTSRPSSATYS